MRPTVAELQDTLRKKKAEGEAERRAAQERLDRELERLRAALGMPAEGSASVAVGRSGTSGDIRIDYPVLRLPGAVLSITVGGRDLHDHVRNDQVQDGLCRLLLDVLGGNVRLVVVNGK